MEDWLLASYDVRIFFVLIAKSRQYTKAGGILYITVSAGMQHQPIYPDLWELDLIKYNFTKAPPPKKSPEIGVDAVEATFNKEIKNIDYHRTSIRIYEF